MIRIYKYIHVYGIIYLLTWYEYICILVCIYTGAEGQLGGGEKSHAGSRRFYDSKNAVFPWKFGLKMDIPPPLRVVTAL